ncbi:hypothetical protein PGTUg99_024900 [Puccinia graminis f. sp. tritici]|uniref:Uncharacterized protein n=1 Tax=Puccinia graminis f. sp. tritici TaxID=56615 RepID=A0A5B0SAC7_PUCGR|nr:hypothetical protein PGTUg99_024900 [Puccinia graminis f. sp. tritici]
MWVNQLQGSTKYQHYIQSMSEASLWMAGSALRFMLCMLLLHSPPSNPVNILKGLIEPISEDLIHQFVSK